MKIEESYFKRIFEITKHPSFLNNHGISTVSSSSSNGTNAVINVRLGQ